MGIQTVSSLTELAKLDRGEIDVAVKQAFEEIREDIGDRPAGGDTWALTVTVKLKPAVTREGALESIAVQAAVATKLPPKRSRKYVTNGNFQWNELSPRNPNQRTLDLEDGAEQETHNGDTDA